jgi:hypothetical protein
LAAAPNEAIGKLGKAPNEATGPCAAPNEAVGKLGKAPNEARDHRAERSQFARRVGWWGCQEVLPDPMSRADKFVSDFSLSLV